MTQPGLDASALLDELVGLPAERRLARLQTAGGGDEALIALGDQAEGLALVEVTRALTASEIVVALADQLGSGRTRARARRARAQALAYSGRHEDALATCQEARRIAQDCGEPLEAARALSVSMHPLGELGRYVEAVRTGETAREELLAAGSPELAARADFNLGVIHQNRDDPAKALFYLDRAAGAFRDNPLITGYLQNNRGEALLLLNEFDGAEAAFRTALHACDSAGASLAAAIAEGNLADLAARRGHLSRALHHFEQARRRLEKDEAESHRVRLLAEQAEAMESLGLPEDALRVYREVLPRLEAHGLAWESARARAGLGKCLLEVGRPEEAETALALADHAFARLDHPVARARVQVIRAELALDRGDAAEAEELLEQAASAVRQRPVDAALVGHHRARLAALQGDKARAMAEADTAIRVAETLGVAPLLSDLLHLRARLRRGERPGEAIADLERAITQVERLRGALQAERFRAAFLGNRLGVYEDLVLALLDSRQPGRIERVFATIERAKSRSLLDTLRSAVETDAPVEQASADPAEVELRQTAERLRAQLNALYCRLADLRATQRRDMDADSWRKAVETRERELHALEGRLASARGVTELYQDPVPVRSVQQALGDDVALISYFIAQGQLLALIVTRTKVRVSRKLARLEELTDAVQRMRFQMQRAMRPGSAARSARLVEDARRELQSLHDRVFDPLHSAIDGAERLVIVPHGVLHTVPFQALWDGRAYLLERYEIAYAPSASVYAHLRRRSEAAGAGRPLVIATADEFAPHIQREAHRAAEVLGARLLGGSQAATGRVKELAPAAGVVHFACHGQFSSRHPLSSGLRLSDRWLTLHEILELRLAADLVTLSSCDTGRNLVQAGDELIGLLRGFLAAGARSVIASLWPAHDQATAHLMTRYYELWRDGGGSGSKAAALRKAQGETMCAHEHPAWWAPFILVGEP